MSEENAVFTFRSRVERETLDERYSHYQSLERMYENCSWESDLPRREE
jgi:hypothetical protein